MSVAICPGSFDPITNGHVCVIKRAAKLFDRVVVCIMVNAAKKNGMFTIEERVDMAKRALAGIPKVEVVSAEGLLAEFAKNYDDAVIVKGLRSGTDFEYERQMDVYNKRINPEVETVFLSAEPEYMFLSSTAVRELSSHGADITGLVPDELIEDIEKKALTWR